MNRIRIGAFLVLFQAAALAAAQVTAVPPLVSKPERVAAKKLETLLTDARAIPLTIRLAPPSAGEQLSVRAARPKAMSSATAQRAPLKIGFVRDVESASRTIEGKTLDWQPVAGGGKAARIEVTSPNAAAIRVAVSLFSPPMGVVLRFVGAARAEQVFGPYSAGDIAAANIGEAGAGVGAYWSPVLEGETGIVELFASAGVETAGVALALPRVAHLLVAGNGLRDVKSMRRSITDNIGAAGACETDIKCVVPTAALNSAASSVSMIIVNDDSFVYQCTATLLNDSIASATPYLFSATRCFASDPTARPRYTPAQLAATANTYWFFDAIACGDKTVPNYALVAGGAKLLARSDDYDWALVRMNLRPPAGANFSAWRAEALTGGTPISVIHHPAGDLKKFSSGTTRGYATYDDGSTFASVGYTLGVTERGSSGAPLFTLNAGSGFYEVRGGLYYSGSSCSNPTGLDDYSRLDIALPLIGGYLSPNTISAKAIAPVVEYYHAGLNDYFVTVDPAEINCLDTGCHPGWERTGLRFLAYTNSAQAPVDATPVCRFYVLPASGNSHFYSADPAECAQTAVRFKDAWVQESPAIFYIQLPNKATGACPANTQPVYRFVNAATPLHHRYTAEVDVRNCLAYGETPEDDSKPVDLNCAVPRPGLWIQEGYGAPPDASVMCAPTSLN